MTDNRDELLDAVDLLTKDRRMVDWVGAHEHDWQPCPGYHDAYAAERCTVVDCPVRVCGLCGVIEGQEAPAGVTAELHRQTHPPLLVLLLEGTGQGKASRSSDVRIPIDADALELWGQVHDLVRLWCKQLDATFVGDDLLLSVRHWHLAHANALRSGKISEVTDHDVTRMVQGWVRMIERKFEPDEKREWTTPCPAMLPILDIDGELAGYRRCGARRIVLGGEERFAIQLNVTTKTAECGRCHTRWEGERGLMGLRFETNLAQLEADEREAERQAELARLAAGDTPEES